MQALHTHRTPGAHLRLMLAVAAAVYLPFVAWSWHEEAPTGDLVRIGAWSERLYGWRTLQEPLAVRHNRADKIGANAWVLGDSFSMGNVWQSVWAERSAMRVYSQGYQGHACVQAFVEEALGTSQASVDQIVVQTIERHLLDRFASEPACPPAGPLAFEGPPGQTAHVRGAWVWQPGLASGLGFLQVWPLVDWRHLVRAQRQESRVQAQAQAEGHHAGPPISSGDTLNAPLSPGPAFSSRRADRLLYFLGDDFKRTWTRAQIQQAAARAAALQAQVQAAGKHFTLLVVPDKSTVYRPWMSEASRIPEQPVLEIFRDAGVNIVFPVREMREAAAAITDFYLPDDTHLSPAGFAWLGRHMQQRLADQMRPPSGPTATRAAP